MANEVDGVHAGMGARVWRVVLLLLCAAAFVALCTSLLASINYRATTGIIVASTSPDFVDHIVVVPNSPAALSGLRTGDLIYRGLADQVSRYRLTTRNTVAGAPLNVPVMRNGRLTYVVVTPRHRPLTWSDAIGYIGYAWILAFATIIIVRRSDHPEARLLAAPLIGWVIAGATQAPSFATPWPELDAALSVPGSAGIPVNCILVVSYAMLFGRPLTRTRKLLARITYAACALNVIWAVLSCVGAWFGTIDPNGSLLGASIPNALLTAALFGLPVVCVALAIGTAVGEERRRLVWTTVPLCAVLLALLPFNILLVLDPGSVAVPVIGHTLTVLTFITPVALTYALLSRRFLDIGFALNRAAVFTATTLLITGSFAALQWLTNTVLVDSTGRHNVAIELAITVIVYYAIRGTRARTDAIVTTLFFSHRDRRIRTIDAIASSVDNVNDAQSLTSFVATELLTSTGITSQVLLENSAGNYTPAPGSSPDVAALDRDDRTTVFLRTTRAPVNVLHMGMNAVAFPLLVRSQLRGILICRPPDDESEFAPDESRALLALATKMAAARDDLLAEAMRRELASANGRILELREQNLALQTRLAALDAR